MGLDGRSRLARADDSLGGLAPAGALLLLCVVSVASYAGFAP